MKNIEGKRLQEFMKHVGLKQTDLAELLGTEQPTISKYINGSRKIPLDAVKTLHIKHKLNYNYFFHGTGPLKAGDAPQKLLQNMNDIIASLSIIMATVDKLRTEVDALKRKDEVR